VVHGAALIETQKIEHFHTVRPVRISTTPSSLGAVAVGPQYKAQPRTHANRYKRGPSVKGAVCGANVAEKA
jgi:hypothetical protein